MCLSTVTETDLNEDGIGYKVVQYPSVKGEYYLPFYDKNGGFRNFEGEAPIEFGKEYVAHEEDIENYHIHYTSGFHIFSTARGALDYAHGEPHSEVVKVTYREAHTAGTEMFAWGRVVVARYITFVEVL